MKPKTIAQRIDDEKQKILARLHQPFHLLEKDARHEDARRLRKQIRAVTKS
jgi:hypothetical protein